MDEIKTLFFSSLPPAEKVLWMQFHFLAGYNRVTSTLPELCDELNVNVNTTKKHLARLRDRGALTIQKRYKSGKERGCMGATYQLVPPALWLEHGEPV